MVMIRMIEKEQFDVLLYMMMTVYGVQNTVMYGHTAEWLFSVWESAKE